MSNSSDPLESLGEKINRESMEKAKREFSTMPVFTIKAKDNFAIPTIRRYQTMCNDAGLTEQAKQVELALEEIARWRVHNPLLCKLPDHKHVAVNECGGSGAEQPNETVKAAFWEVFKMIPEQFAAVKRENERIREAMVKWHESAIRITSERDAAKRENDALKAQFKNTGIVPYLDRLKELAAERDATVAEAAKLLLYYEDQLETQRQIQAKLREECERRNASAIRDVLFKDH